MAYKYECSNCKKTGVKLWRDYNCFMDQQDFTCFKCTNPEIPESEKMVSRITGRPTDQIGDKVPAVPYYDDFNNPTKTFSTCWGYTSVPSDGVNWWVTLPFE